MFDVQEYYKRAHEGANIDSCDVLEYVRSFKRIVIWGASYLGSAVGEFLLKNEIKITAYWDLRAQEIKNMHGIDCVLPFEEEDKEHTLVIFCIGNTAIMNNLLRTLQEHGFKNVLRGDYLFMGSICPFHEGMDIYGNVCNGNMTCRSIFCLILHNIVKKNHNHGGIFLDNITFMINTRCSLQCKYCVAYMNSYPGEKRQHYSTQQILDDIDAIFDTFDAVGSVTVQGGEPFLHPDIDKIIEKLLSKKNFGILSIPTNGIYKVDEKKLDSFRDPRLNVAFSGYYDALPKEKLDIYYKNIEQMEQLNIPHTVGAKVPEWQIPPTLWNREDTQEVMQIKKQACRIPERCLQVADGRLYPCLVSVSIHNIGIADYPDDYVELKGDHLKERIQQFMDRPFYWTCGHCHGENKNTSMAGEQGFYDFVTPQEL